MKFDPRIDHSKIAHINLSHDDISRALEIYVFGMGRGNNAKDCMMAAIIAAVMSTDKMLIEQIKACSIRALC